MAVPPLETMRPRVGVAAIITGRGGKILVGKRKSSHGAGTWQLPGGHLEYKEDIIYCAEREVLEETALTVKGIKIAAVTNDVFERDSKHYITLFVQCDLIDLDAEPQVTEPDKCESWHWKSWDEVKAMRDKGGAENMLFLPIVNLLDQAPDWML